MTDLKDLSIHLTNVTFQKDTIEESKLVNLMMSDDEFWKEYEKEHGKRFDLIGEVGKMMIELFDMKKNLINLYQKGMFYQLYGIDVMMDRSKNVYLLELNSNPQFETFNKESLNKQVYNLTDDTLKLTVDRVFDNKRSNSNFIFLKKY